MRDGTFRWFFRGVIALIGVAFLAMIGSAVWWSQYKTSHHCVPVMSSSGYQSYHSIWKCDGGEYVER